MQCELFDSEPWRDVRVEIARPAPPRPHIAAPRKRRTSRERADEAALIGRLQLAHAQYNATLFDRELATIKLRISRRMKNRLGHYMVAGGKLPAEIAISLRHVERDPWSDVLHTLVHEMVHQWQDENGHALDHGPTFRVKARDVGISARATRPAKGVAIADRPKLAARRGRRQQRAECANGSSVAARPLQRDLE
ncbi:MAG: SprT-like domain-containing protein [Gemmatimonadota bacterium]|nr:SprT-like domain-containing protein [Gemmatimonadota bacterium]